MSRRRCFTIVVLVGATLLAACGSTGQPSGTATGSASGASGDKSRDFEFSACMRSHGVSNFPDPTPGGGIELPTNLDPQSPAFRSARQACKRFLPNKGTAPKTSAGERAAALTLARCMRAHRDGVRDSEFGRPEIAGVPERGPRVWGGQVTTRRPAA
jgi:hypothetical protein